MARALRSSNPRASRRRECEKEAEDILFVRDKFGYEAGKRTIIELLQSKQDELNALREKVLGVIEPFANDTEDAFDRAAAKALRDKLKEK